MINSAILLIYMCLLMLSRVFGLQLESVFGEFLIFSSVFSYLLLLLGSRQKHAEAA